MTATTLTVFWPWFQGTTVLGEDWANSIPLEFISRWPYLNSKPGEPERPEGSCKSLVYTTWPVAGASGTSMDPVTLKPCEFDLAMVTGRTLMGGLPGCAVISTSFSENGAACATSVTDADGTNTAAAKRPTRTSAIAVT